MQTITKRFSLLIITLVLVSCGAKNKGQSAANNAPATIATSNPPSKTIEVADLGTKIEVITTEGTPTEVLPGSVTIPNVTGPVLIQVISPSEITEMVVNVDPENPAEVPLTVVEIIVEEQKPVVAVVLGAEPSVYENIAQQDVVPAVTEIEESPVVESLPSADEVPALVVTEESTIVVIEPIAEGSSEAEKNSKLLKRISVLEHLLDVHTRDGQKSNRVKVLEWSTELQSLKDLLSI